jgi:hypothetical protein
VRRRGGAVGHPTWCSGRCVTCTSPAASTPSATRAGLAHIRRHSPRRARRHRPAADRGRRGGPVAGSGHSTLLTEAGRAWGAAQDRRSRGGSPALQAPDRQADPVSRVGRRRRWPSPTAPARPCSPCSPCASAGRRGRAHVPSRSAGAAPAEAHAVGGGLAALPVVAAGQVVVRHPGSLEPDQSSVRSSDAGCQPSLHLRRTGRGTAWPAPAMSRPLSSSGPTASRRPSPRQRGPPAAAGSRGKHPAGPAPPAARTPAPGPASVSTFR